METSVQRLQRLLGALEDWFNEASFLLKTGHFAEASLKRTHCQNAITDLAILLQQAEVRASLDTSTQQRCRNILDDYNREAQRITVSKDDLQRRISALGAAKTRAKNFRGAYVIPSVPGALLSQA